MFLSNSCYVLAIVVSSSLFDLSSAADFPRIAGYKPTTDVEEVLDQDLIQAKFQEILGDESCSSVDAGLTYYEGDGSLLKNLPTYKENKGAIWNLYEQYYGSKDFCDEWVTKALKGGVFKFDNGKVDFSKFPGNLGDKDDPDGECVGREECAKKATAYICGYINVFQYLEKAVVKIEEGEGCVEQKGGCTTASKAWDSAVAFFVGSAEGVDGNNTGGPGGGGQYGTQFYALGDKRCDDFRTCGATGDTADRSTPSKANILMLGLFQQGASAIYAGDVTNARAIIKKINIQAAVPFIQGTLRYAYRLGQAKGNKPKDKEVAEGGTFLAGALPQLWKCDKKAAKIVFKELQIGSKKVNKGKTNFKKVLKAFECNYECLGITCAQIGVLFDGDEFDAEDPEAETTKPRFPQCTDPRTDVCAKLDDKTIKECKKYRSNKNTLDFKGL